MTESANLKEFLRTGNLGKLHLGQHENDVATIWGTPDNIGGGSRKYPRPSHWTYGDIELFFDYDLRILNAIVISFLEPEYPTGGNAIQLDPWIIKGGLRPEELIHHLDKEGIDYCDEEPLNFETRQLLVNSVITIIFNNNIEKWAGQIGLCKLYAGE